MMRRMPGLAPALLLLFLAACDRAPPDPVFHGYAEGDYLRMAAPEGGWLTRLAVTEGQSVTAGTLLFTLDDTAQRAAVAEAEARLAEAQSRLADLRIGRRPEEIAQIEARTAEAAANQTFAEAELARQRQLARTDVAARARLEQAQAGARAAAARVQALQAELAAARLPARADAIQAAAAVASAAEATLVQARWRLAQRQVTAPTGLATTALVDRTVRDPGEWVPASGVVVSLLPADRVTLVFFVPEPLRAALAPGQAVAVDCTGCEPGMQARVTYIAAEAEYTPPVIYSLETRSKLVWRVEAEPLGPGPAGIVPGQPITVRLPAAGRGGAP